MHPRIDHLTFDSAGKMVGGHVADAIAASLDTVPIGIGQHRQDPGVVGQVRPVELDVLAGGNVTFALVLDRTT